MCPKVAIVFSTAAAIAALSRTSATSSNAWRPHSRNLSDGFLQVAAHLLANSADREDRGRCPAPQYRPRGPSARRAPGLYHAPRR